MRGLVWWCCDVLTTGLWESPFRSNARVSWGDLFNPLFLHQLFSVDAPRACLSTSRTAGNSSSPAFGARSYYPSCYCTVLIVFSKSYYYVHPSRPRFYTGAFTRATGIDAATNLVYRTFEYLGWAIWIVSALLLSFDCRYRSNSCHPSVLFFLLAGITYRLVLIRRQWRQTRTGSFFNPSPTSLYADELLFNSGSPKDYSDREPTRRSCILLGVDPITPHCVSRRTRATPEWIDRPANGLCSARVYGYVYLTTSSDTLTDEKSREPRLVFNVSCCPRTPSSSRHRRSSIRTPACSTIWHSKNNGKLCYANFPRCSTPTISYLLPRSHSCLRGDEPEKV